MICVVIPTRNRPILLARLLGNILSEPNNIGEVIVVDSSDSAKQLDSETLTDSRIKMIKTMRRSAAVQRNIGLDAVNKDCKYLFFLDDDVLPNSGYFEELLQHLTPGNIVGASGLALNPRSEQMRTRPRGLVGFVHKLFLLDSEIDGKLLPSGVNIPVRYPAEKVTKVEWLIGCSAWDYQTIKDLRFENDFEGQSLAEDVIFSVRASARGILVTDPRIVLSHDESELGRATSERHWEMWMTNRWRLTDVMGGGLVRRMAFWWASLGQCAILFVGFIRNPKRDFSGIRGIFHGALKVQKSIF